MPQKVFTRMKFNLHGPGFLIPGLIIGFGFTILGGFVAGRVSKSNEVLHGGVVGFITIFFGLLFWAAVPRWHFIISLISNVPFGMLGGRNAAATHEKNSGNNKSTERGTR